MRTILVAALALAGCTQASKAARPIFGEVEADEVDVASRLPGRVAKLLVTPGQAVKKGDVLVEFEGDLIEAKRLGAQATVAAAESRNAIAKDAVRPEEKAQLRAGVEAAKKALEFATASLDRMRDSLKEGAVSQQMYDEVKFKADSAQAQYDALVAKLKMAEAGARPEEKAGAAALVEQASSLKAEVEAYEKDLRLAAPIDGEVAQILNHEGELVPTGYPVITLLRRDTPWVTVNVPETRLKELPKDATVKVRIPALDDKELPGKVTYIAAMAGFATKTFTQDKSSFDLKTFEVRVTLENGAEAAKLGIRPGMTAIVQGVN